MRSWSTSRRSRSKGSDQARKFELDLQAAELGLKEYQEGTFSTLVKDFRSKITLAEVDLKRQTDRIALAHGMVGVGYLTAGQLSTKQQTFCGRE